MFGSNLRYRFVLHDGTEYFTNGRRQTPSYSDSNALEEDIELADIDRWDRITKADKIVDLHKKKILKDRYGRPTDLNADNVVEFGGL